LEVVKKKLIDLFFVPSQKMMPHMFSPNWTIQAG